MRILHKHGIDVYLTRGILVKATSGNSCADRWALGLLGEVGNDPEHCLAKVSSPPARSNNSLSDRWSCIE